LGFAVRPVSKEVYMKLVTLTLCSTLLALPLAAQNIKFGNNSSEYANDGECDDRRFTGVGMAKSLNTDRNFTDANDCRSAYRDGRIKLWVLKDAAAATQCSAIRFGNNKSEYSRDGECDDARFEGPGTDEIMTSDDIGQDAADCRRLCKEGRIFLRDY
jgi:hypothetical protein